MGPSIELLQLGKMLVVLIAGYTIAHYILKYMDGY